MRRQVWMNPLNGVWATKRAEGGGRRKQAVRKDSIMGEAKRRGTPEERAQQARARVDALRPAQLVCGSLQDGVHQFRCHPGAGIARHRRGIRRSMPELRQRRGRVQGRVKAVAEAMLAYERMMGESAKLGYQSADGRHVPFDADAPQASDASDESTKH
jgi:hypothetical protein